MKDKLIEKILSVAFSRASDPSISTADLEILSRIACNIYSVMKSDSVIELMNMLNNKKNEETDCAVHFNGDFDDE